MKKLMLIVGILFSLNVFGQTAKPTTSSNEKASKHTYCATVKDGKVVVKNEDKAITADAVLDNGIRITSDGYIVKKDGNRTALKSGQCVNESGDIISSTQ